MSESEVAALDDVAFGFDGGAFDGGNLVFNVKGFDFDDSAFNFYDDTFDDEGFNIDDDAYPSTLALSAFEVLEVPPLPPT